MCQKLGNENTEILSKSTSYAVKILNEVKASYNCFAKRDFGSLVDFSIDENNFENDNNIFNNIDSSDKINTTNSTSTLNTLSSDSNNMPESNCLALVVRKDYSLTIFKNFFTTTGRLSWKIALITTIINILNMLF